MGDSISHLWAVVATFVDASGGLARRDGQLQPIRASKDSEGDGRADRGRGQSPMKRIDGRDRMPVDGDDPVSGP
jgi:hypothetical protein